VGKKEPEVKFVKRSPSTKKKLPSLKKKGWKRQGAINRGKRGRRESGRETPPRTGAALSRLVRNEESN